VAVDPAGRGEDACGLFVSGSDVPVGNDLVTEGAPFRIIGYELAPASRVAIVVHRDGTLIAERVIMPRYEHRSVGDSCSECLIATESVPVR
jgi:hypothetical protein